MCLRKIQPTISLSDTIPRSMSARYQYGITVADACKVSFVFMNVYKYFLTLIFLLFDKYTALVIFIAT